MSVCVRLCGKKCPVRPLFRGKVRKKDQKDAESRQKRQFSAVSI
jgi:hypothetical protein